MRLSFLPLLPVLSAISISTLAAEQGGSLETRHVQNLSEEQAFLALLSQQTQLATKTKMNAEFVPGMVSVLLGTDLETRGIHTVWEALGSVAGMTNVIDNLGGRGIKIRGLGGDNGIGHMKIMLDSIDMSSAFIGHSQPIMDMPIEQVERIEVIRGAGSALYGENAFTAVVNVITKKQKKELFSGIGKDKNHLLGANYAWDFPEYQASANLNLAFSKDDGSTNSFRSDEIVYIPGAANLPPGGVAMVPSNESEERGYQSLIFKLDIQDFQLNLNWLNSSHGSTSGDQNAASFDDDFHQDFFNADLNHSFDINPNIQVKTNIGWHQNTYDSDFSLLPPPPGFLVGQGSQFAQPLDNSVYYRVEEKKAAIDVFINRWERHSLLFGVAYSNTRLKKAKENNVSAPLPPGRLPPPPHHPGLRPPPPGGMPPAPFIPPVNADHQREQLSFTLQDEYNPSDSLMLTLGARFDSYNDIGDNFSPRLAAVYHLNKQHILKAQYAEAFRPPTFLELAPTPDIKPQTNKTVDIGYLYKKFNTSFAVTAYYSKVYNVLVNDPEVFPPDSSNKIEYKGIEFEAKHKFANGLNLNANLSYGTTKDIAANRSIPFTHNWLANTELHYRANHQLDYSARYQYVGKKSRDFADPREKLDAAHLVHLNARVKNILSKGTSLQFGVNNLFNEDAYPFDERSWWLRLKYQL